MFPLDELLEAAHLPDVGDWRRLRGHVAKWRGVYEDRYRAIRRKAYAHRAQLSPQELGALFSKISYEELERLFAFLDGVSSSLYCTTEPWHAHAYLVAA